MMLVARRTSVFGVVLGWAVQLLACRERAPERDLPERPESPVRPPIPVLSKPGSSGLASSRGSANAVTEARERLLSLQAPDRAPRKLAFGRDFLVQLQADGVRLLQSTTGLELARTPIREPRSAVTLPGGSVLVAGLEASFRFDPNQRTPHRLVRLSLLPGSEILPNLETPNSVWVFHAPLAQLMHYDLGADSGLGLSSTAALPGVDGRAFAVLRDGHLLFTSQQGLVSFSPRSLARELPMPHMAGPIWRILPAYRLGRAWLVSPAGDFLLIDLGEQGRIVHTFATGQAPFDVAALGRRIVLISVSRPGASPRRFWLQLYNEEGQMTLSEELPSSVSTTAENWTQALSADKQLALGEEPPRVAVGGPGSLRVYDLERGARLFEQ